jgi:hypothetical protein
MSRLSFPLLVTWLVGALAACGIHAEYIPLAPSPHPLAPRPASEVEVLINHEPARPYTEVGLIEVRQEEHNYASSTELMARLRRVAGDRGCDAVQFAGDNDGVVTNNDAAILADDPTYLETRSTEGYRGVCLMYTDGRAPRVQSVASDLDDDYPARCRPMRARMRAATGQAKLEIIKTMPKECL